MTQCRQLILFIAFGAFVGCASNGSRFYDSAFNDHNRAPASLGVPEQFDNEEIPSVDAVHTQADADFNFLRSDLESLSGRSKDAIEFLMTALKSDPDAPTLMQKLAVEYYKRSQTRDAIYWAEKAKALAPDRRDIVLLVAGLYTSTRSYPKAEQEYLHLLKFDKDDFEAKLYLGAVYSEMKNYKKAIQIFTELSKHPQYTSKYLVQYYLARVYLEQGSKNANVLAQSALRASLKMKPDFFEAVSLLGQLIHKQQGPEKAFAFYADFQKNYGPQPKIAEILAQYYIEKNKYDLAYEQLEFLDSYSDDMIQVKLKMALILIDKKNYDPAINKLQEILVLAPESDKVRFYLSAVYEEKKAFQKAFDEYMKISKTSTYFEEARLHAAYLSKMSGQSEVAQKVLQESINNKVENPQTLFLMAQFHEDKKEYNKVLEILNLAENKFPKNSQVQFYKGSIQDKMNLKDQMIISMKKVLDLDQEHIQAMNYLAFSWAEMNIELDQAEKYARFAVSKGGQSDAFILDTLGWVLFKKGQFKEATEVLEKAYNLQPTVGIIAEHLGDVYNKVEKFEKARVLFQKAVENETDSDKKKDIQQKLSMVETNLKARKPASSESVENKIVLPQEKK
jgi:tetratricopeptide (TPR) repeat protein